MKYAEYVRSRFGIGLLLMWAAQRAVGENAVVELWPSGDDDQPSIQSALNSACASGNTDVVLRNGEYHLNSLETVFVQNTDASDVDGNGNVNSYSHSSHLVIGPSCNNVALRAYDGEVAQLVFLHIANGILVNRAIDVRFENVSFDWYYHPFGQGTVYSVDPDSRTVIVSSDSGYANWDNPMFFYDSYDSAYLHRTNRGNTPARCDLFKQDSPDESPHTPESTFPRMGNLDGWNWFQFKNAAAPLGNGRFKVEPTCPDGIGPGDKVVLNRGAPNVQGIHMIGVAGAMLKNLNFYSSPGVAVMNEHSVQGNVYAQINLIGVNVDYHPTDTSRTMSTNANAFYSTGSRAALYIADSRFYGQGDDAIDFSTQGGFFVSLAANGVLRYRGYGMTPIRANDFLEVFNTHEGQYRCGLIATAASYLCNETAPDGGPLSCVTVDSTSCPGAVSFNGANELTSDWIVNGYETHFDASSQTPTVIENNLFFGSRGRGILNHGWSTVIRYNDIGDWYFGGPNFGQGILEGFCPGDFGFYKVSGRWVYPGRDNQMVYDNYGYYGDSVSYCVTM